MELGIVLRELHRAVDGGMVRHVEKQDLRRADGEQMHQALVLRRLVEPFPQGVAEGARGAGR